MLKIKENKQKITLTLSPRALELLGKLAGQYGTSKSMVIDTMAKQYGPKLLKGPKPKEVPEE